MTARNLLPKKSDDADANHGSTDPESALAIPDGLYWARVYRLDVPEEHALEWLQARFDAATLALRSRHGSVASYAAVLTLAAIITAFLTSWTIWGPLAALAIAAVFAVRRMGRNPAFEKIRAAEADYDVMYPAYVAELRSV